MSPKFNWTQKHPPYVNAYWTHFGYHIWSRRTSIKSCPCLDDNQCDCIRYKLSSNYTCYVLHRHVHVCIHIQVCVCDFVSAASVPETTITRKESHHNSIITFKEIKMSDHADVSTRNCKPVTPPSSTQVFNYLSTGACGCALCLSWENKSYYYYMSDVTELRFLARYTYFVLLQLHIITILLSKCYGEWPSFSSFVTELQNI